MKKYNKFIKEGIDFEDWDEEEYNDDYKSNFVLSYPKEVDYIIISNGENIDIYYRNQDSNRFIISGVVLDGYFLASSLNDIYRISNDFEDTVYYENFIDDVHGNIYRIFSSIKNLYNRLYFLFGHIGITVDINKLCNIISNTRPYYIGGYNDGGYLSINLKTLEINKI